MLIGKPEEAQRSPWKTFNGVRHKMPVSYQTHAGDAGVVGDVGDMEDLSFILTAGLRPCKHRSSD